MFVLFSGLFSSCSKNNESPSGIETNITTFMEDFSAQIMGLTFDSKGNMYVATYEDQLPKRILKITHDGEISTLISIECFAIENIIADKNDSIYASVIIDVAEGGAKIFKITHDAKMSLFSEGFTQPVGITFDLEDNLFVVDAMAKKVYKISPSKEKSIYIDLGIDPDVPDNFYHGIDFDNNCKNLFIAGLNNGGTGNLLRYPINADGNPGDPIIISDHLSKHVEVHNNIVYATIDYCSLLIINEDGSQEIINDPLLTSGMNLCFGQKEFGESTLYINSFDKIVEVNFLAPEP